MSDIKKGLTKLTKEQAIVISAFTGVTCCSFSLMHEEIEKRLGRPVFIHQFPELEDEISSAFLDDFLSICLEPACIEK